MSANTPLMWILFVSPVLSILLAVLTVSPKQENLGTAEPETPVTMGPH